MKKEAMLYEKIEGKKVHCFLCAHHCKISPPNFGVCGVRQNIAGSLFTHAYGEAVAAHVDPIEKKPLYHFLPGTQSYSVATIGCNFRCGFCQNWQISQESFRDRASHGKAMSPAEIVSEAKRYNCDSISYTYTEPTIFFEYTYDTAKLAKEEGLKNVFVTNGYMTKEALTVIRPYLDAANVDLKGFTEEFYTKVCKARLQPVLETIRLMRQFDIWVEVTTLIVPGTNDSDEELRGTSRFMAGVDKDMPWHVSAFHPDYQYTDYPPTPIETLRKAKEIGLKEGLRYIYIGNVAEGSDTHCHGCGAQLVKRSYFYAVEEVKIKSGYCQSCGVEIKGLWQK